MPKIPKRFLWAVEIIAPKPDDIILEIGCGAGLLAEQLALKLTAGKIIAVDRSAAMISKAVKRNKHYIDNGIADFLTADFLNSELPEKYFDSITAFNVNFFLKESEREFELIKQLLKPEGSLYFFYQAPFEIDIDTTKPINNTLIENGFKIKSVHLEKMLPFSPLCIIATINHHDRQQ